MSIPFDEKEILEAVDVPNMMGGTTKEFKYPVTPKEAFLKHFNGEPVWQINGMIGGLFAPKCNPDNIARGFVYDASGFDNVKNGGGLDMFGIDWEYIVEVGGSMVRPGKPFIEDANELKDKIVWPDIDAWDWEGSAKVNEVFSNAADKPVMAWFLNGWYERLISFMDFEGAIMAVFDEDQQDAVHEFFDKLSDLYIRIFDKYIEHFPFITGFYIHDDWGSQKETFFSPAVAEEMIVPYMRRVTDHLHSKGMVCELHSCGQLYKQVPNIIAAGWDTWSGQEMNDTQKIYEDYGDKLVVGVIPDYFDPETTSEEDQRALAREFANKFCKKDKPSVLNFVGSDHLTPAYLEELYRQSRINYAK